MSDQKTTEEKIQKADSILKTLFSAKRLLITIAVVVLLFCFTFGILTSRKQDTKIAVSSVLKDINVISELSTLLVPYNSIYIAEEPKKKETDQSKYKYYSAYEGTVTMGLDLKNVKQLKVDDSQKTIFITLPEIKILDTQVDHDSLETIYVNKKYEKEGNIIERRKECDEDLRKKVKEESHIWELARESAEGTIRNLISPIVNKQYGDYEIIFEWR